MSALPLAVVIPTKDRPALVQRLLAELATQTCPPARTVVVDGSATPALDAGETFRGRLLVEVIAHRPASAAAQRNRGIRALTGRAALIALLDDDIALAPNALERMQAFFHSADAADVIAAGFNQVDDTAARPLAGLKRGWLADRLGLYRRRRGAVARSGWQSILGPVGQDTDVDWLPTTAAVWRAEALRTLGGFDEFFTSYSYLEDLELSWRARQIGRLVVVATARYEHGYATAGKVCAAEFGRCEVRNRLYFVRKHGLSMPRCIIGLTIRAAMTLAGALRHQDRALFGRFRGNLRGAVEALWH